MMNQKNNFKGKVIYYSNVNGQEKRIEKEFTDPNKYQEFIQNQDISLPRIWGFSNLDELFEQFFTSKLENFLSRPVLQMDTTKNLEETSWEYQEEYDNRLSKYEEELQKIEQQKQEKKARKSYLSGLIDKLKEYKKKFEKAGIKEKIKEIEDDIKKAGKELKELDKE